MVTRKELQRQIDVLRRRLERMSKAICRDGHKYYYDHDNECKICIGCGEIIYDDQEFEYVDY